MFTWYTPRRTHDDPCQPHNFAVPPLPLCSPTCFTCQFAEFAGKVYPDEYEAFLSNLAFVNVDIGFIFSNACILSLDFYDKLVIATVGPMVLLLALACTFVIATIRNQNSEIAGLRVKDKHLSIILVIIFFVYSSVSFTIFQTFVCDRLDDGVSYLRADYSLTCSTKTYTAYRTYASIMVCVYPIGIPAFFGWWLVRNRQELEGLHRETRSHLQPFSSLWIAYKPSCYYYEVVEYGRRIVLTGAAVFIMPGTAEQIAIVLLLAVVFTFISESLSPFKSKLDMWLYRWGNGVILASMYVALLLKVDLTTEGSRTSSSITVLLIAANVFLIITVVVQSGLLIKAMHVANRMEVVNPVPSTFPSSIYSVRNEERESFAGELEMQSVIL